MAVREIHVNRRNGPTAPGRDEASLRELLRQLGDDVSTLAREELALAKLEMKQEARELSAEFVKVIIALELAMLGAMALTAFLVLVVGQILGDAFWAGALIVGVLFLAIGGLLARNAMKSMKERDHKPDETIDSLREDARWAKQEAREFKREVRA